MPKHAQATLRCGASVLRHEAHVLKTEPALPTVPRTALLAVPRTVLPAAATVGASGGGCGRCWYRIRTVGGMVGACCPAGQLA